MIVCVGLSFSYRPVHRVKLKGPNGVSWPRRHSHVRPNWHPHRPRSCLHRYAWSRSGSRVLSRFLRPHLDPFVVCRPRLLILGLVLVSVSLLSSVSFGRRPRLRISVLVFSLVLLVIPFSFCSPPCSLFPHVIYRPCSRRACSVSLCLFRCPRPRLFCVLVLRQLSFSSSSTRGLFSSVSA